MPSKKKRFRAKKICFVIMAFETQKIHARNRPSKILSSTKKTLKLEIHSCEDLFSPANAQHDAYKNLQSAQKIKRQIGYNMFETALREGGLLSKKGTRNDLPDAAHVQPGGKSTNDGATFQMLFFAA